MYSRTNLYIPTNIPIYNQKYSEYTCILIFKIIVRSPGKRKCDVACSGLIRLFPSYLSPVLHWYRHRSRHTSILALSNNNFICFFYLDSLSSSLSHTQTHTIQYWSSWIIFLFFCKLPLFYCLKREIAYVYMTCYVA